MTRVSCGVWSKALSGWIAKAVLPGCRLVPETVATKVERQALLRLTLIQQQMRSHGMVTPRAGHVLSRLACVLRLMGLP